MRNKKRLTSLLTWFRYRWSYFRERPEFRFRGLQLFVADGVLNPTLFTASKVFAKQIGTWLPEEPCDVLELGCGCGIASLVAAGRGHRVCAVDVDPHAIANTLENARRNGLDLEVVVSDWDAALAPERRFDRVICNPPFLPGDQAAFQRALQAGPGETALVAAVRAMLYRLKPNGRGLLMTSSQTPRAHWRNVLDMDSAFESRTLSKVRHWQERLIFDELFGAEPPSGD